MPIQLTPISPEPVSSITLSDVKQELERRRFPKILSLDDYQGIVDATCRELTRYTPITKFVSFTAQLQVTDYYVFDPDDPADLADAMEKVLLDRTLHATLAKRSLARAKEFTWERTARLTRDVLGRAAGS